MKVLNTLILSSIFCLSSSISFAGNLKGDGGDFEEGLRAAGLIDLISHPNNFSDDSTLTFKHEFVSLGLRGLAALRSRIEAGETFDVNLTTRHLDDAMIFLLEIDASKARDVFKLDINAQIDGRSVTAINFGRKITLNPNRWNTIAAKYNPLMTDLIKSMVAAHEALSVVEIENTNYYPVSAKIVLSKPENFPSGTQTWLRIISDGGERLRFVKRDFSRLYFSEQLGIINAYQVSPTIEEKSALTKRLASLYEELNEIEAANNDYFGVKYPDGSLAYAQIDTGSFIHKEIARLKLVGINTLQSDYLQEQAALDVKRLDIQKIKKTLDEINAGKPARPSADDPDESESTTYPVRRG